MFSRFSSLFTAMVAFTIVTAAMPDVERRTNPTTTVTVTTTSQPAPTSIPASQCSTGPVQCCNSLEEADSLPVATLLGLLGVVIQGVDVLVGITCSPLSVIGIGSNSCNAQAVCCQHNDVNGVVAIGCTPVNLNL
ncbi:hypothetical protein EYR40_003072 [Pleurotus pulmonarius]|nr:hypothetical protein EYR40_003072 [Pleurotus pulmonarius]